MTVRLASASGLSLHYGSMRFSQGQGQCQDQDQGRVQGWGRGRGRGRGSGSGSSSDTGFVSRAARRDWYAATPAKPTDGLANALLAQEPRGAGGRLRVNFDPALLAFSEEARCSSCLVRQPTASIGQMAARVKGGKHGCGACTAEEYLP